MAGRELVLGGTVIATRSLSTRAGRAFLAATLEDETGGSLELTVWPDTYEQTRDVWQTGTAVLAAVRVRAKDERLTVGVQKAVAYVEGEFDPSALAVPPSNGNGGNGGYGEREGTERGTGNNEQEARARRRRRRRLAAHRAGGDGRPRGGPGAAAVAGERAAGSTRARGWCSYRYGSGTGKRCRWSCRGRATARSWSGRYRISWGRGGRWGCEGPGRVLSDMRAYCAIRLNIFVPTLERECTLAPSASVRGETRLPSVSGNVIRFCGRAGPTFCPISKLPHTQSLYELGTGAVDLHTLLEVAPALTTFFGLRREDLGY